MIGEFSELTGISKRMIRHFDALGLLAPHAIDEGSGYRFYSSSQIHLATKIRYLQEFGFSLKEIHALILTNPDSDSLYEVLRDQEVKLRTEADQKIGQLLKLKQLIDYVVYHRQSLDELPLNDAQRSLQMDIYQTLKEEIKALPSSMLVEEHIDEMCAHLAHEFVSFVTFDIDQFIKVNENFGFETGDKVIYRFHSIIQNNFKTLLEQDVRNRYSRLGGDEFGILLFNIDQETLIQRIEGVLAQMRLHDFNQEGCSTPLTSSCGLYTTSSLLHAHELMHNSTKALISAKRSGRDQYAIYE